MKLLHKSTFFPLVILFFLLQSPGCDSQNQTEPVPTSEKKQNIPESSQQDTPDREKAIAVEQYFNSPQIVSPWHEDDAYRHELLLAIEKNEQDLDPETGFLWGTHRQPKGYHSQFEFGTKVRLVRETMYFAAMLIADSNPEQQARGCRLLENVIALQDQDPESATFGIWPWYYEEPLSEMVSPDYNWADFLGAVLATVLHDYADRLSPDLLEKTRKSLTCASMAIIKRDVKPSYTNIAMMGAAVTAAAGELLGRNDFLDYGRMRIRRNLRHYRKTGNFIEYNSPIYTSVVIHELERMLYLVDDPTCRKIATELLIGAWQTVAEHYHVPTKQWAGPFSRTYFDTIPPQLRNTILTQACVISQEEQAMLPIDERVIFSPFVPRLACPEHFRHYFTDVPDREIVREHVFNKTHGNRVEIGITWLTPNATLGSVSHHTFWKQARGLIAYWTLPDSDEPAVFKFSFLHDGKDFASACARNRQSGGNVLSAIGLLSNQGSMHSTLDRPEDGAFVAESFEIVYQLIAPGAQIRELSANVFEFSAGSMRTVLHIAEGCIFNGQPVLWQIKQTNETETAMLIGICYRGEPKTFQFDALEETRIGVGLEILRDNQKPSLAKVSLIDAETPENQEGRHYCVQWEPVTGHGSENRFVVPAFPTPW